MENENRGPSQLWHGWIASSIHIYRGSQNIIDIWSDKHGKWKQRTLSTLTALSFLGKRGSWETTRFLIRKFSPPHLQARLARLSRHLTIFFTHIWDNLACSLQNILHPQTRWARLSCLTIFFTSTPPPNKIIWLVLLESFLHPHPTSKRDNSHCLAWNPKNIKTSGRGRLYGSAPNMSS